MSGRKAGEVVCVRRSVSPVVCHRPVRSCARWLGAAVAVAGMCGLLAAPVWAVSSSAGLTIHSFATPNSFSEDQSTECATLSPVYLHCDAYEVTVTNAGSQPTTGAVTITDTLPSGLKVQQMRFRRSQVNLGEVCKAEALTVRCPFAEELAPDETLQLIVEVTVQPGAAGSLTNTASVSGGGTREASTSIHNEISSVAPAFGVALSSYIAGVDGASDTQAGAHPYEMTTRIDLNNEFRVNPEGLVGDTSVHDVKDVVVDLPLGFLGSALATPMCTLAQLAATQHCPADTAVGHILTEPPGLAVADSPLYNMVPEHGVAAELGFFDSAAKAPHVSTRAWSQRRLDMCCAPQPAKSRRSR